MAKSNGATQTKAVGSKRDKFAAQVSVGVDPKPRLKRGIIFPRNRHPDGGFILTKDAAIDCGWFNMDQRWETHINDDGVKQPALVFESMRFCVVSATPSYA